MALAKLRLMNGMELMMIIKKQDFIDFEVVLALYTICSGADVMIDEIEESDLPEESLRDGYRAVRESISSLIESIEQYRDDKKETFMSACED